MRVIIIVSILLSFFRMSADPILVGLNYGKEYLRATIFIESGSYVVTSDEQDIAHVKAGETLDLTASGGRVNVFYGGKNYEGFTRVEFIPEGSATFKIQPAGFKKSGRLYASGLRAIAYQGRLQLINKIELEDLWQSGKADWKIWK